jgi:hypothetical protein
MNPLNRSVPLLGQNGGVSREQAAKIEILQAINSLSLAIYTKLASEHMPREHLDIEKLKSWAKNSRMAAEAYFEGLGIISK